jgi:hypothetical protein
MNKFEIQSQELYDNNIQLFDFPLDTIDACCVNFDKNNYICINKNRDYSSIDKYWITEHELEHIKTNSFYSVDTSKLSIKRREYKANDALIKKHNLATSTIELIKLGLCKSEICEELQIPLDLFDHIINYIKRKGIM